MATDFGEARRTLNLAAVHLAPTVEDRVAFTRLVNDMLGSGEGEEAICLALLGAMADGLRYGNWPSQIPPVVGEEPDSTPVDTVP